MNTKQGRPRVYKTDKERDAARRLRDAQYQKEYLAVRRKRYQEDPEYRKCVIERERRSYRKRNPESPSRRFGANAGKANSFASTYRVKGSRTAVRALTITQMAEFLGVTSKVLNNWISCNRFPRPSMQGDPEPIRLFSVPLANELAKLMADGLKHRFSFRETDTDLIVKLHATKNRQKE